MSIKENKEHEDLILRNSSVFTHIQNHKIIYELPVVEAGDYVVDDSCFVPMSEAIKQLNRINDPTSGQLAGVYDFPNGKDTGKQIPITRMRDFGDLAEISQEVRNSSEHINDEILRGQLEAAEKEAFAKEMAEVRASSSKSSE